MFMYMYLVRLIAVGNFQCLHGNNHDLDSLHRISVDERLKLRPVSIAVALAVDNSHLFNERTLPSFPRPYKGKKLSSHPP